jgi:hypothetical protein
MITKETMETALIKQRDHRAQQGDSITAMDGNVLIAPLEVLTRYSSMALGNKSNFLRKSILITTLPCYIPPNCAPQPNTEPNTAFTIITNEHKHQQADACVGVCDFSILLWVFGFLIRSSLPVRVFALCVNAFCVFCVCVCVCVCVSCV